MDQVTDQLEKHGIKFTSEKNIPNVCRQIFAHDPSGNMIEFNQRLNAE
jgi:extradiol dioxygenase family protein